MKIFSKLKFEANWQPLFVYYIKMYIHFQQHTKNLYDFNSDMLTNF
jgi:hypothetical protein